MLIMLIKDLLTIYEYEKHVNNYLDNEEYKSMLKNLNEIFNNAINLATDFNFDKEIEKLSLVHFLMSVGYFSTSGRYPYNNSIKEIWQGMDFYEKTNIYSLVPILGDGGCCRHTASLLKTCLTNFGIKSDIVSVDVRKNDPELTRMRHFLSEYHHKELSGDHVINYVSIDDSDLFVEGGNSGEDLFFHYGDKGLAFPFLEDNRSSEHLLLYNYSPCYEQKKNYDKIKPLSVDKQIKLLEDYARTINTIENNMAMVVESYRENMSYMFDIKNSYQKVYAKERKFREWLGK